MRESLTVIALGFILTVVPVTSAQTPVGTTITYQGLLTDANGPVESPGTLALAFYLYDAPAGGSLVAGPLLTTPLIENGVFTVDLDFGPGAFGPSQRWLEIEVFPGTFLSPRQPVRPAPVALYALEAATDPNAGGADADWTINGSDLYSAVSGNVGIGTSAPLAKLHVEADEPNQAGLLVIAPAIRIIGTGFADAYNIVLGSSANQIDPGASFATIGGGTNNTVNSSQGTIAGGAGNTATGNRATVSGGINNQALATSAVIAGGLNNAVHDWSGSIGGGTGNVAGSDDGDDLTAQNAVVAGGSANTAGATGATVSGGGGNTASALGATVGGGSVNTAGGTQAVVSGGLNNAASGARAAIGGGMDNLAPGDLATVAGGGTNQASNPGTFVGGGENNTAAGDHAVIGGGRENDATGIMSFIGSGFDNLATSQYAAVVSGQQNGATGFRAFIGGGSSNAATSTNTAIAGGAQNDAQGLAAIVGGGEMNAVWDDYGAILGGTNNTVGVFGGSADEATHSTIGGGQSNAAIGPFAAIPGGENNTASGGHSFAAGRNAQALHDNSFVWSGDPNGTSSTGAGQFVIDAPGGVQVGDGSSRLALFGVRRTADNYTPDGDPNSVFPFAAWIENRSGSTRLGGVDSHEQGLYAAAHDVGNWIYVGVKAGVQAYADTGAGVIGWTQLDAFDPNQDFPHGVVGQNVGGSAFPGNVAASRGCGVLGVHGHLPATTQLGTVGADRAGVAGVSTLPPEPSIANPFPTGVYGRAQAGGYFDKSYGVRGIVGDPNGASIVPTRPAAVFGDSSSGHGVVGITSAGLDVIEAFGVFGFATDGDGVGVFGAHDDPNGVAGRYSGRVEINGSLAVSGFKNFRIDHPLDPENKYLYHACVESDRPLNTYQGSVVTDGDGFATVTLPAWFDAINADVQYQLTVIDDSEDFVLAKVVDKVRGNQFRLRTSKPTVEVSWQITGARSDAYARAKPFTAVREKGERERGRFLYPRGFGRAADVQIGRSALVEARERAPSNTPKRKRGRAPVPVRVDPTPRAEAGAARVESRPQRGGVGSGGED